mgnify:CR=1 FL=1
MSETLKQKTAKSLFWGAMNNGFTQVLNLVIGIFLGRLLSPEDYGIVGVLTIFTVIAGNLQSSGFTQGLINLKTPTARDYNAVFWFNILASFTIYAVLFLSAPAIAWFFHEPRLVLVSRVVFLSFVISSFGIAHNAYLLKNMMNREIAVSSGIALIVSGTLGIVLALKGYAYWSLVWQQIVYITVLNMGRYYFVSWHPSRKIDFQPVREMFGFCVKILATNILNTLSQQVLTFIFGRLFPIKQVGNYTQANKWNTQAHSFVSGTLSQVAQPLLVTIQGETDREVRIFRKMMRFTAFLSFPVMLGLALVANEFIVLAITEKWLASVPLMQILCIAGAFLPFYTLYQNLAVSNGRSDIYLWVNVAQVATQIILVIAFAAKGMQAVVIAYTVFVILWLLVWHFYAHKLIGIRLRKVLADIVPFLFIALGTMACTYFLTKEIRILWLLLLSRIAIAIAIYTVAIKIFRPEMLNECLDFLKKRT